MDIPDHGEKSVSTALEGIKSSDWAKKVYQPDSKATWDRLHKELG